jgi:hypothetical protein
MTGEKKAGSHLELGARPRRNQGSPPLGGHGMSLTNPGLAGMTEC